ncbi:type II toxin-antitoxin system Phd/YefM family antitoxin [Streptomyces sp. ET3-23]|uniref:type II toxin-antitoxin system Phd/YefM family antitoxin n=1 Tax=Streptomyces sp. ET3-23 TaxID=2885643 RepID=UPI001D11C72B|nr:type II toxin-antitoxin system Phd/YefM family antitoxin [Streptomyces sp. ET3-23]MCC2280919.1 type II toxin-antitoxin system Phd/YefM family antitoxin [Streptomyces sp. ET3-23]
MDTNQSDHLMSEARANFSDLIGAVHLMRRIYYVTRRNQRRAAIMPADLGELIEQAGGPDKAAAVLRAHLANAE